MEEEISIKEIVLTLWQGRYIIISFTVIAMLVAFVVSYFFTTPLYEAEVIVDTEQFAVNNSDILQRNGDLDLITSAVSDLTENPKLIVANSTVTDNSNSIRINIKTYDPDLSNQAAYETGIVLLNTIAEYELEHLYSEKKEVQKNLSLANELMAEYLGEDGLIYAELVRKEENIQKSLSMLDEMIKEIDPNNLEENSTIIDPVYLILLEKKGRLFIELFELNILKQQISEGVMVNPDIIDDPALQRLSSTIEGFNNSLFDLEFTIDKTEKMVSMLNQEDYIYLEPSLERPVNTRWPLNTAVAGVLGVMLSVLIVFIKPHLYELTSDLKENSNQEQ